MIPPAALPTVRIFLFKPERLDSFYLRLAISMSSLRCEAQVIDQTADGVRRACFLARTHADLPQLVLFHYDRVRSPSVATLRPLRESKEFEATPIVVIGDGDNPAVERLAHRHGADAFIPLPTRACDLAHTGRDIERFWEDHRERHRNTFPNPTPRPIDESQAS